MPGKGAALVTGGNGLFTDIVATRPLLALKPLYVETVETTIGDSEATFVIALSVLPDGGFVDHGEHPIFWGYVRTQLRDQCDEEYEWLYGYIEKGNRAYRITPPTPAEVEMADRSVSLYEAAKVLEAEVEAEESDAEPAV